MKRNIFCICLAVLFMIGIMGNISHIHAVARQWPLTAERTGEAQDALLSVHPSQEMDDFHIRADGDGMVRMIPELSRGVAFLLLAALLLLFCMPEAIRDVCFQKKKIPVFHVILFIHWKDGKKKTCSAQMA